MAWDKSCDGVVDADDLLAAFDTDGDGAFDRAEIAQIALQLNEQTELNNTLLQQLSELEVCVFGIWGLSNLTAPRFDRNLEAPFHVTLSSLSRKFCFFSSCRQSN